MRLVGIEIRRAFARRLTKMVIVVMLGALIAAGVSVFFKSSKTVIGLTGEQVKARELSNCLSRGEGFGGIPPGLTASIPPEKQVEVFGPPVGSSEREEYCRQQFEGAEFSAEGDKRFKIDGLKDVYKGLSVWLAIVGWLLAASYIGAEWRAGTMTTLLTWEPRRMRVMLTKLVATMVVVFALVMLLQALLVGVLIPSAIYRGTFAGTNGDFWRAFSFQGLRIGGLAVAASALGFAAGSLGRNTAAGLGTGFVYIAVVEGGLLGGLIPKVRPWLILGNAIVFIDNKVSSDIAGRTPTQAGLLLLGYAAGFVLIAAAFFKKRDVT